MRTQRLSKKMHTKFCLNRFLLAIIKTPSPLGVAFVGKYLENETLTQKKDEKKIKYLLKFI